MSLTLQKLYSETKNKYQLSLIAGSNGLSKNMSWVYISEDLNTADFLLGGELIITTGVSSAATNDWLRLFIKKMIDHNTSGLILNIGKYIETSDITQDIIDMCNEADFALFTMPWKIHIYDISKDYYNRIFIQSQEDLTISNAFLSVIRQDSDYAKSIHILEDHGYELSADYCLSVIDLPTLSDDFPRFSYMLNSILRKSKVRCQMVKLQTKLILICSDTHYDRMLELFEQILHRLQDSKKDLTIHEGIGGPIISLKRLHSSYTQANAALSMAHFHNESSYHYNDMGFFKLLLAVNDTTLLHSYVHDLLGEIQDYDKLHNSSYIETLRSYLLNDGSIQAIAGELFCHRNTVNYRIHSLKEHFCLQLDDPKARYDLMTAYLIMDYLALEIH